MSLTFKAKLQILWSFAVSSFLVACGAHGNTGALPSLNQSQALTSSRTFHFTHAAQKFRVPQGVTQLTIIADGAQGGGYKKSKLGAPGGLGAKITATVSVTGGALLFVYVGGVGVKGGPHGNSGGFNGGGGAFTGAYGGGGSSDVRTAGDQLTDRIIVAGGGGGTGANGESSYYYGSYHYGSYTLFGGPGGIGGMWNGKAGGVGDDGGAGGGGGYQTFGGAGGAGRSGSSSSFSYYYYYCSPVYGGQGKLHIGGEGADDTCGPAGGGGGGGYYGGGGGGGGGYMGYEAPGSVSYYRGGGGGGGGGASFVEDSATHRKTGQGKPGNGLVIIEW